eukprot:1775736-Prymnesium_polylepis.1
MVMRLTLALARVGRVHVCSAPPAPTTALGGARALGRGTCRCATVERARSSETHHHGSSFWT